MSFEQNQYKITNPNFIVLGYLLIDSSNFGDKKFPFLSIYTNNETRIGSAIHRDRMWNINLSDTGGLDMENTEIENGLNRDISLIKDNLRVDPHSYNLIQS